MKLSDFRCRVAAVVILTGPIAALVVLRQALAQTAEDYSSGTYTENFSGLPMNSNDTDVTASATPDINGTTYTLPTAPTPFDLFNAASGSLPGSSGMTGWYASNALKNVYAANGGSTTTGGIYTFFSSNGSTNPALGIISTSTSGTGEVGVLLFNSSSTTYNSISLSYEAELWHQNTGAKTLDFGYEIESSPTALPTTGLTPVAALGSGSFLTGAATATDLATPVATNNVSDPSLALGSSWAPGTYLWLTWTISGATGTSQGIGIANLNFSASATSSAANDVWNVGSGNWDTVTGNWTGGSPTADLYKNGDNVTFDNQSATGGTITIASNLTPGFITVSAPTGSYFFTGAGMLNGTGSLQKSGAGTLDLTGQTNGNGFTGGVSVTGGTLVISADNQLGAASGPVTIDNATLSITSSITGMNRTLTLGVTPGDPETIATNGNNLANAGATAINGLVTTTGSGNVALNGAVTFGATAGSLSIPVGGSVTLGQLTGTISFGNGSLINGNLNIGVAGSTTATRVNFDNASGSSPGVTGSGNINILSNGTLITNAGSTLGDTVSTKIVLNSSGSPFTKGNVASATYTPGTFVTTIGGTTSSLYTLTVNSVISGASDVNFANGTTGGGSGTIVLGGQSTYTGTTTVNPKAGTVQLAVNNALPVTTDLIFGTQSGASGAAIFDLGGINQQVASLSVGTGFGSGASFTILNGGETNGEVSTLTVSGSTTPATDFSGSIQDGIWGISLVKGGPNTLALSGANSYTGTTTVTGGTLLLDFSQSASPSNILYSGGSTGEVSTPTVSIGGATLQLKGGSGLTNSQQLYGLTVSPGGSTIFLNQNGATSLTLAIGALTQTQGGVVNFSVIPQSTGVVATTTSSNVNGILGTWATVGSGTTLAYATQTGVSNQIGAYTGTPATTAAALTDTTGTVNYDLTTATGTVPSTFSANTIRYLGSGGATTAGATSFTVNGLLNAGSSMWTIGTNAITIGANKELDIVSNTQGMAIFSVIKNNGGGASALTVSGSGTVTLTGANTYTGGTFLDGGTLALGTAQNGTVSGPMGASGNISFGGGALEYTASNTTDYSSRFSTAVNQEVSINTGGMSVTFATALTSVGGSLNKTGTGNLTLSATNTYSGGTTIQGGTLFVNGSIIGNTTVQSGGTLGGTGPVGNVEVQSGGNLEPGLTISGPTMGTTSASGLLWDGGGNLLFDLSTTNNSSSHLSLGTGAFSEGASGQYVFNFLGGGELGQTYTLITFGATSFVSASAFSATDLASGLAGNFALTGTTLTFTATSSGSLPANVVWAANSGVGTWDTVTGNWTGGTPTADLYKNTDNATFDDTHSGAAGGTVTIEAGGVTPDSTTVNTAGTYTFQNTGGDTNGIGGTGSLAIKGTGKVILTSPNTYSGGTVVSAGTLQISADNQLGASSGTLSIDNATLAITSNITGMNRALTLGVTAGDPETIATNGNNLANSGTTAINGQVTTTGSGNVALNGAVTFGATAGSLSIPVGGSVTLGQLTGTISFGNGSLINGNLNIGVAGSTTATRVNFDNASGSSPGVTGSGNINILSNGTLITNAGSTRGDTVSTKIVLNSSDPSGTFFTKGNVASATYTPGTFVTTIGGTTSALYTLTVNSVISGASDVNFANGTTGGGSGTIVLGGQSTYTGTTTVNPKAGTVQLAVNNALPVTTDLIFGTQSGASGAAIFDLGGINQQVASLSVGTGFGSGASFTILNGGETNGEVSTLTVSGSTTPATDFSGSIQDGIWGISLVKGGPNTLALSGANSYTGTTTVTGGTLLLDFSQSAAPSNILYSGGSTGEVSTPTVSIGGATLQLKGGSGLTNSQQLYGLTVSPGGSTIFLNQNGATSLTLAIGAMTQTQGGVVNFSVIPQFTGVVATTSNSNVNGILGTWATVGSGTTLAYATQTGVSNQIGAYTGTAAATAAGLTDTTGTVNYDLTTATGTVPSTFSANTIRYLGSGGATTAGATSFTVNGLLNAGSSMWTIGTNAITIGANKELDIVSNTQGMAIFSVIKNNGGGASALTVSGSGTVTLTGANTYTGGTFIDGGTLGLGVAQNGIVSGPMGASGPISFGGGTLQYSASNTTDYSSRFSVAANQEASVNTGGQNVAFATALTSVGGSLNKTGTGNLTLAAINTYSGGTTVNGGALLVNGSILGNTTVESGGTLGGTGSGGNVEVQSGGNLEPGLMNSGPSTGVFSASSLRWDGGGDLLFALSTTSNASSELSLGSGALEEGASGQYAFNFLGGGEAGQTYDLVNFGSTDFSNASAFTATNLGSGLSANFELSGSELQVQIQTVPEPSSWAALTLGAGLLVGLRRFRRGVRA